MRCVAFSDLHLDAPFAKGGPELSARRRAALRDTLAAIGKLVREVEADVVLCAGDLFEHDRVSADTASLLRRTFAELAPTPVLLAPGNHDWYGDSSIYAATDWSDNVHVFASETFEPVEVGPTLTVWGAAHLRSHGTAGFFESRPAIGQATVPSGSAEEDQTRTVHLGLFHGSEVSDFTLQGDADKVQHAPFRGDDIPAAGLHHAIVGHYHRRREAPFHTYPGNPAALSFGERGDGGAVVIDVALSPDGELELEREWRPVSNLDVHDIELDVTGLTDASAVLDACSVRLEGLRGLARLSLLGEAETSVDRSLLVESSVRSDLDHLELRTTGLRDGFDLAAIADEPTVRGEFVREVQAAALDPEEQRRIILTGLRAFDGADDLEVA